MSELCVDHCTECGKVYQKNIRQLCGNCSAEMDRQLESLERYLLRHRDATTEQLAEGTQIPLVRIRGWIRSNKLAIAAYPNLADHCDLCQRPTRSGHLCTSCRTRISSDISDMFALERKRKDQARTALSYKFKS
ncbi:hypothetical protein IDH44_10760 [Paenibacillus sp. IB182496]|uniref:Flagellar protein n=1 Tax=Paenibacillus sabuli TaxID=2772509 RepID=A0A927GS51_9BACL|nr:hypothetical protein [Paenibacillus sabuli]